MAEATYHSIKDQLENLYKYFFPQKERGKEGANSHNLYIFIPSLWRERKEQFVYSIDFYICNSHTKLTVSSLQPESKASWEMVWYHDQISVQISTYSQDYINIYKICILYYIRLNLLD